MTLYRKKALLEVIETTFPDGDYRVQNQGDPSDQWIIPKRTFELTYERAEPQFNRIPEQFGFSQAIELLKAGYKVQRKGWNGKGMWLMLVEAYVPDYKYIELGGRKLLPWIGMKTADGSFVPWLASQTDMLADDWMLVT